MKYECPCGYVYDPEVGDPEGGIAPDNRGDAVSGARSRPLTRLGGTSSSHRSR